MRLQIRQKICNTSAALAVSMLMLVAIPAQAQRGGGGVYIDIAEPDEPEAPAEVKPALSEDEKLKQAAEEKRKAEEEKRLAAKRQREWEAERERRRIAALDDIYPFQDKKLQALVSRDLETYASEGDFIRWLKSLKKVREDNDGNWISDAAPARFPGQQEIVVAAMTMQDSGVEVPCAKPEDCPDEAGDAIVTTGTKISRPNITNVQSAGVDEGDIVKQIGHYLLTLQDGRIFVVDIRNMKLTDRADVYRRDKDGDPMGASWYDEMLVQDDHIIITAYDYREDATELSIFSLDQKSGKIGRDGVFLISSDDYYDVSNYASRIIDNQLVLYAPYGVDPDDIDIEEDGWKKPFIRRWLPGEERDEVQKKGKPLFGAQDIFKPVLATNHPVIHTISVCPLGGYRAGQNINCRTTGLLGPQAATMYVNASNIYLWNSLANEIEGNYWAGKSCTGSELSAPPAGKDAAPGALYKISVRSGDVTVAGVNGGVFDQYSMDEYKGRLRALSPRQDIKCASSYSDQDGWTNHVALLDLPLPRFADRFIAAKANDFAPLPVPGKGKVQNRFSGSILAYGGQGGDYYGVPDDKDEFAALANNYVVTVPISSPEAARKISLGHSIERLELVGEDAVTNGYRDDKGLSVSFLKLDGTPRMSDQIILPLRYETESRSHAFNSITAENGSSVMGIPTSLQEGDSDRYSWWSARSDISFISVTADGKLSNIGEILGKKKDDAKVDENYVCEVSCIDWYGNARPIFTDGRIFGLMDTSLVEAKITDGKIGEKARLDLTAPLIQK